MIGYRKLLIEHFRTSDEILLYPPISLWDSCSLEYPWDRFVNLEQFEISSEQNAVWV